MDLRNDCWICFRKVASGLGRYPFTCANGHTLYRGSGASFDMETGKMGIPARCYEPPASEVEWMTLIDQHRKDAAHYATRLNEVIGELNALKAERAEA